MTPQPEMTPERWQQITELFHAALDRPPAARQEYLRSACGDDHQMYSEVASMLDEHTRSGCLDRSPLDPDPAGSPPVFSAGQSVAGRYRIIRFIGRGGMGEVYEAEDGDMKIRVALKTLLPAIADDAAMIGRFKQEIQLSRKVAHPNVCRVFDLNRHPPDAPPGATTFLLTMEFLEGETLADRLARDGRMTPEEALPLIEQMAGALDAAHRAGVIHRDFKPSNVMLERSAEGPRAVVTDFGLARSFTSSGQTTATQTGHVMGTLDYMAPELLTGGSASAASDVYALGMVVYQMVTGVLPFAKDTPLAAAILRSQAPLPSPRTHLPDLDPKWERAILRALDPDRLKRFSHASDMVRALRGETRSLSVSLPAMTRRRWMGATAVALMLVAAWVGWRIWSAAKDSPPVEAMALYQRGIEDLQAGAYFAATKALGEALRIAPAFTMAHVRLAEAWIGLDVPERAREEMLLARRQDSSRLSRLERLRMEAVDLTSTREFDAAAQKYEQIRAIAPRDTDVALDLGRAYEKIRGKSARAIDLYRQITQTAPAHPAAWLHLAILYSRVPDWEKCDQAFQQAESAYQLTSNNEGLTEVAFQRGIASNRRGREEAESYLHRALDLARLSGNLHQEIRAKLQLATWAYVAGNSSLAEQYAREAIEAARANQMDDLAASATVNLGNAFLVKGDFATAEKYYRDALDLARRGRSERMAALALLSLAGLHAQVHRADAVAGEAREALTYYESHGFALETSFCLTLLGRLERDRGDFAAARGLFGRALEMADKSRDRPQMAQAHENLGSVFLAQENYPEGLREFRQNLELSTTEERKGYAALQCGDVLWRIGRYDDAARMLGRAEPDTKTFPLLGVQLLLTRAEMALSRNQPADAAEFARRALAADTVHDPSSAADLKRILGLALIGRGAQREGLRACEEAMTATMRNSASREALQALLSLAQARLQTGNRTGALDLLGQLEARLTGHPESRWRAFALRSRVEPAYIARAQESLADLHQLWGDDVFSTYLTRPDIQKLSGPLLSATAANQK